MTKRMKPGEGLYCLRKGRQAPKLGAGELWEDGTILLEGLAEALSSVRV